jgi:hypothetical protein
LGAYVTTIREHELDRNACGCDDNPDISVTAGEV